MSAKKKKATPAEPVKKLSLLNAALEVLKGDNAALNTKQMVEAAKAKGY